MRFQELKLFILCFRVQPSMGPAMLAAAAEGDGQPEPPATPAPAEGNAGDDDTARMKGKEADRPKDPAGGTQLRRIRGFENVLSPARPFCQIGCLP